MQLAAAVALRPPALRPGAGPPDAAWRCGGCSTPLSECSRTLGRRPWAPAPPHCGCPSLAPPARSLLGPVCSTEEDRVFENALAQFWEHSDRSVLAVPPPPLPVLATPGPAGCQVFATQVTPRRCRLEKCTSLLSRKDLAAVKRRYQQLEVGAVHTPLRRLCPAPQPPVVPLLGQLPLLCCCIHCHARPRAHQRPGLLPGPAGRPQGDRHGARAAAQLPRAWRGAVGGAAAEEGAPRVAFGGAAPASSGLPGAAPCRGSRGASPAGRDAAVPPRALAAAPRR